MQALKETTAPDLLEKIDQFDEAIFLNVGQCITKIALNSILFVKGYGDYMKIQCKDRAYTAHITMTKLEEKLPSKDFFRVHRSYLVRLDQINRIMTQSIEVQEAIVPLSRNVKASLLEVIPLIR